MDYVVRAVDVGFGNTKFVSNVAGSDIRCACFPSVAYPTMREPSGQPGYERRKTVAIPINGLFYEVGPEVELAADTFRATQMHDRYTETPEYMALLRGALALADVVNLHRLRSADSARQGGYAGHVSLACCAHAAACRFTRP